MKSHLAIQTSVVGTILRLVISLQARYQLQELKKLSSTDNKFKALRDATKRYRIIIPL